ncbi:hypothetical protein NQ318_014303 [Aromia moschata]|uniref:Uncharacterized protein n=1 Tax=Aromia moschata TaxID=1265417 RepID=A0AAV8Z0P5_9CUCU|nr:hypothetical protein NQ318_014303 [Aromia moschata]
MKQSISDSDSEDSESTDEENSVNVISDDRSSPTAIRKLKK